MEGHESGRRLRHALRGQTSLSSSKQPLADGNLAGDRTQEEYVDALFRELEKDPATLLLERRVGHVLLGTGLVLIVVGFLAMVWVKTPELLLSLVLGINVLAVLCVAAGVLLLPERPTPRPADANAARGHRGSRLGYVRSRLSLPHLHIRHARH